METIFVNLSGELSIPGFEFGSSLGEEEDLRVLELEFEVPFFGIFSILSFTFFT